MERSTAGRACAADYVVYFVGCYGTVGTNHAGCYTLGGGAEYEALRK